MSVRTNLLCASLVASSAGALGITGARAWESQRRAEAVLLQLRTTSERTDRLQILRTLTKGRVRDHDASLTQRTAEVLGAAGLPSAVLSNLSPESETLVRDAAGGSSTVRRRVTLALTSLTLPQVGAFLAVWREREPAWSIASIEITPETGKVTTPGGDLPLRVIVVVETLGLSAFAVPSHGDRP